MIPPEVRAEIRRLFFAEHFTVNAIQVALSVHRDTVVRAIDTAQFNSKLYSRKSLLDRFAPFVRETLERYPKLRSSRLLLMLRDRGYTGSIQTLRRLAWKLRPTPSTAYLALNVLPGEQGQIDWGHFGTILVGRAVRNLSMFVLTCSYSRHVYARFTLDQTLESFLRGHVSGFREIGGVPRVILYDNLKAAVLERVGTAIRFNPALLEFAGQFHFRPVPCNVAAGWEKGRVERTIGYIRTSYAEARTYRDLDDANAQLRRWLDEVCNVRSWPQDRTRTVADAFAEEQPLLLRLPEHDPGTAHVRATRSGKTPYVRFDLNDYTIPHTLVRKPLTLVADETTVRILNGTVEVARHVRSYDRGRRIEDRAHLLGLLEQRPKGVPQKAQDWLREAVPQVDELLRLLALRGENLGINVQRLSLLLHQYGVDEFTVAVAEAVSRETPRSSSVASILVRRGHARREPPSVPVHLPDDPRVRGMRVATHDPATYDALSKRRNADDS